ncbi:WD40 repeat domain-containing protein [Streptomyces vastus]|uniref:WD40 repeat domain-containing protein n=1 Tax=Streptomyces vastus TaxID=285451 RepID=A0ABP6CPI9_9ACTN
MNVDELVRDSLREQATEQPPLGPGFVDRVLTARRRRRTRTLASVAAATAAVVAIAVAVPMLESGKDGDRLATGMNESDIIAHPDQSPPRDLIAAGDVALAAYYTRKNVEQTDDRAVAVREYWLLDQKTGKYEKAPRWSFIDIAPGMRTAAVLEKDLPTQRIGLLNLLSGKVERWIPVDRGVAGVEFSPDGDRLVATTYKTNPDLRYKVDYDSDGDGKNNDYDQSHDQPRNGFYVIDVASGQGSWSEVPEGDDMNARQDFDFSHDGKLVYSGLSSEPYMQYYDFEGNKVDKPANGKYTNWFNDGGVSPNGKLVAGNGVVLDAYTGERIAKVRGYEPLAWVDDERLIVWYSEPGQNEFHNRLVIVTIGSDKLVRLSGARKGNDGAPGRWTPVFAKR